MPLPSQGATGLWPGVPVNEDQAAAIGHLAALHGTGTIRRVGPDTFWLWFRARLHDWCIDDRGCVVGWNEVEVEEEEADRGAS